MNDDKALLEAAARAAGMMVLPEGDPWPREDIGWFYCLQHGEPAMHKRGNGFTPSWRPLTDDGDALRLGAAITMQLQYRKEVGSDRGEVAVTAGKHHAVEGYTGDYMAATRRAIVRAAAALGQEAR